MLLMLTWAAGSVDAISYLGLGHVFTAMMTGNTVLLGLADSGLRHFSSRSWGKRPSSFCRRNSSAVSALLTSGVPEAYFGGSFRQASERAPHANAEPCQTAQCAPLPQERRRRFPDRPPCPR